MELDDIDEIGVWRILDLTAIHDPYYEPYRPETTAWTPTVDWGKVNTAMRNAILVIGDDRPARDFAAALDAESRHLSQTDREGLFAMWCDPITASPNQISSGGHRITAMVAQGLRWTIGYYRRGDSGEHLRAVREQPF